MKLNVAFTPINIPGSHPVRGAWIEIAEDNSNVWVPESHPVRGAWIEMSC